MKNELYQALASTDEDWICCDCALPPFSDPFFSNASLDGNVSIESEVSVPSNYSIKLDGIRPSNSLRCLPINARSLRNKVLDLQALLLENHIPIIAITETWLDTGVMDFELGLNNYSIHRWDRQDRRGGGVLLALRGELIRESKIRRLRTTNYGWTSVVVRL